MKHRELVRAYAAEINRDIVDVVVVVKGSNDVLLGPVTPDADPYDPRAEVSDKFTHNTRRAAVMALMDDFLKGLSTGLIEADVFYRALKLLEDASPDSLADALGFSMRDDHRPVEDNDQRNRRLCDEVRQRMAGGVSARKAWKDVAASNGCSASLVKNVYYEEKKIRDRSN